MAKEIKYLEEIPELPNVDIKLKHIIEAYIVTQPILYIQELEIPPYIITQRQSSYIEPQNALRIPTLIGLPKNCLPLMVIYWTSAANPHILGVLSDTQFIYASIYRNREDYEPDIYELSLYSGLDELFSINMGAILRTQKRREDVSNNIYSIYLMETYRTFVQDLRMRYPKIAHLLIDPPELSSEIREEWQKFEDKIVGH